MAAGEPGQVVEAGSEKIGVIGSVDGRTGLAMVRLDRAAAATAAGTDLMVAGQAATLGLPDWARIDLTSGQATGDGTSGEGQP